MGQYFKTVILDANSAPVATFSSWTMGEGAKLMEHSWLKSDTLAAVTTFLRRNPSRVVWAGDYGDEERGSDRNLYSIASEIEPLAPLFVAEGKPVHGLTPEQIYREGRLGVKYGEDEVNAEFTVDLSADPIRYILNHDRMEFVDTTACPADDDGWKVHPLPLLTAEGNGRGGGDYYCDGRVDGIGTGGFPGGEFVGSWARDRVSTADDLPEGFTEIRPGFIEKVAASS